MLKLLSAVLFTNLLLPPLHADSSSFDVSHLNPDALPTHAFDMESLHIASLELFPLVPHVESHFFTADAIQALPKLKQFDAVDPGYNKIVFKLIGFPENELVKMEIKRLSRNKASDFQPVMSFTIQEDGSYLTEDDHRQKYIVASSHGILPGERVTYRFSVAERSLSTELHGIPNPLNFIDKEGNVAMRAEMVFFQPTVYAIDLPTMQEGEEYQLKALTGGETVKGKPTYSSKKPFHFTPSAPKSRGGISSIEVRRKSGELYFLQLPWGNALDAYLPKQAPGQESVPTPEPKL
jgi:hypothetical protein